MARQEIVGGGLAVVVGALGRAAELFEMHAEETVRRARNEADEADEAGLRSSRDAAPDWLRLALSGPPAVDLPQLVPSWLDQADRAWQERRVHLVGAGRAAAVALVATARAYQRTDDYIATRLSHGDAVVPSDPPWTDGAGEPGPSSAPPVLGVPGRLDVAVAVWAVRARNSADALFGLDDLDLEAADTWYGLAGDAYEQWLAAHRRRWTALLTDADKIHHALAAHAVTDPLRPSPRPGDAPPAPTLSPASLDMPGEPPVIPGPATAGPEPGPAAFRPVGFQPTEAGPTFGPRDLDTVPDTAAPPPLPPGSALAHVKADELAPPPDDTGDNEAPPTSSIRSSIQSGLTTHLADTPPTRPDGDPDDSDAPESTGPDSDVPPTESRQGAVHDDPDSNADPEGPDPGPDGPDVGRDAGPAGPHDPRSSTPTPPPVVVIDHEPRPAADDDSATALTIAVGSSAAAAAAALAALTRPDRVGHIVTDLVVVPSTPPVPGVLSPHQPPPPNPPPDLTTPGPSAPPPAPPSAPPRAPSMPPWVTGPADGPTAGQHADPAGAAMGAAPSVTGPRTTPRPAQRRGPRGDPSTAPTARQTAAQAPPQPRADGRPVRTGPASPPVDGRVLVELGAPQRPGRPGLVLDLTATGGLGLTGPGAADIARTLIWRLLTRTGPDPRLVGYRADLACLLGVDPHDLPEPTPPRDTSRGPIALPELVELVDDPFRALARLDDELTHRRRHRSDRPFVLLLPAPHTQRPAEHLHHVLTAARPHTATAVLLGAWPYGTTLDITPEHTVRHHDQPRDARERVPDLVGHRLVATTAADLRTRLTTYPRAAAATSDTTPTNRAPASRSPRDNTGPAPLLRADTAPQARTRPTAAAAASDDTGRADAAAGTGHGETEPPAGAGSDAVADSTDSPHSAPDRPLPADSSSRPVPTTPPAATPLVLSVLGPVSLRVRDDPADPVHTRPIQLRSRTAELLAFLATRPVTGADRDEIIGALWPDSRAKRIETSLHSTLTLLRQAVRDHAPDDHEPPGPPVVHEGGVYRIDEAVVTVDAWAFLAATHTLAATSSQRDRAAAETVVGLYRYPLAAGHHGDWLDTERQNFTDWYVTGVRALAAHLDTEDPDRAVALLEDARTREPREESLYRDIMARHYQHGRHQDALHTYKQLTAALAEIHTDPEPATVALAEKIRRAAATDQ